MLIILISKLFSAVEKLKKFFLLPIELNSRVWLNVAHVERFKKIILLFFECGWLSAISKPVGFLGVYFYFRRVFMCLEEKRKASELKMRINKTKQHNKLKKKDL